MSTVTAPVTTPPAVPKYPNSDPAVFGPHDWFVLHNTAAMYPEKPNRTDRQDAARFFNYMIRNLPCQDPCRTNTYRFLEGYDADFSSRDSFFKLTVDLHNFVNKETGKTEQYDYKELLSAYDENANGQSSAHSSTCKSCGVNVRGSNGNSNIQTGETKGKGTQPEQGLVSNVDGGSTDNGKPDSSDNSNDGNGNNGSGDSKPELQDKQNNSTAEPSHEETIRQRLDAYKKVSSDIATDVCQKEGIPPPEIVYNECPDRSGKSCITPQDNKIYLNPRSYSVGTIFHELDHYIDRKKHNRPISDQLNQKADQYADRMVKDNFPYDMTSAAAQPGGEYVHEGRIKTKKNKKRYIKHSPGIKGEQIEVPEDPNARAKAIVHEVYAQPATTTVPGQVVAAAPSVPTAPTVLQTDPYAEMPIFKSTLAQIQQEEMQEQVAKRAHHYGQGILSHLDAIYETPANMMGIKAQDLNLMHTPRILQQVLLTLTESFTTPIASATISLLTGILLMVAGIGLKERLPIRDLQFIQMLGSLFFWDVTKYLNPKRMVDLKDELKRINKSVDSQTFSFRHFIETPHDYSHKYAKAMDAQSIAENIVPITNEELEKLNAAREKKNIPSAASQPLRMSSGDYPSLNATRLGGGTKEGGQVIKLPPFGSRMSDRYL